MGEDAGEGGADDQAALQGVADRLDQQFRLHVLEQVAVGVQAHGVADVVFGVGDGEDQDFAGVVQFAQAFQGLQAVHVRHVVVQQDQFGLQTAD